ncbi:AMP-binding protein [Variovorax sp. ZS18.2.2]|uniref:AMP-binding protein n=1 Tax=Variovorax sp. ZS18.2.2 TaxID=2971255 RepID=UPI002150EB40|nr:AMP-binding protein [Variovorax sp. ZS18.2.2]MCR6480871.1 AMP-binding protein [Variovorax sp. ZS18.2.2]
MAASGESVPLVGAVGAVARTGDKSVKHHIRYFRKGALVDLTLAQLDALAQRLARALQDVGFQRHDRVGVLARNGIEWVLLDLASIKLGLVTAGFEFGKFPSVAPLADRYRLKGFYSDAPADVAIDLAGTRDLRPLLAEVLLRVGESDPSPHRGEQTAVYAQKDITTIKFTSGSTGEPKGLEATVGSIDASLSAVQAMYHHRDGDNILVFMPLSLLQQRYWIYSALTFGHDVTVVPFELALDAARRTDPTVVMGVPGFYESLRRLIERECLEAGDPAARRAQIESVLGRQVRYMWTGSAPANPQTLQFFNEVGFPLYEGYGMNETCIVSKNHPGSERVGSVGKPLPGKRVRIDDDGVLVVGSDHPVNTAYAYCEPGDSEKIFMPDGEVRTGDLARIDEDGFLYILGRADDLVVLANGRNVSTRKVEERIKENGEVAECVLYGSGKAYLVAVVSPAVTPADSEAIHRHVRAINETLAPDERVMKTLILPKPLTVESGLLTSQFKPRRKEIYKSFQRDIENLYGAVP